MRRKSYNYNGECAYASGFPVLVDGLRLVIVTNINRSMSFFGVEDGWKYGFWNQRLWVGGMLPEGFRDRGGGCGPCPVNYTLAFTLQLKKTTENLGQVSRQILGTFLFIMGVECSYKGTYEMSSLRTTCRRKAGQDFCFVTAVVCSFTMWKTGFCDLLRNKSPSHFLDYTIHSSAHFGQSTRIL